MVKCLIENMAHPNFGEECREELQKREEVGQCARGGRGKRVQGGMEGNEGRGMGHPNLVSSFQRHQLLSSDNSHNVAATNASCNVTHDCGHQSPSLPSAVLKT